MMKRREFLATAAASAILAAIQKARAALPDLKITRAVGFDVRSQRSKLAGKNSRLDVHGDSARDRMVRLFTNAGIDAVGNCRSGQKDVAALLGKNPFDFYQNERMTGPLGPGTMPLWDLAGKALKKPVYELLGAAGNERVPVYDGSIYFFDLLPQYESRWQDRLKQEVDMAREAGHHAVKVKIGRGAKWMKRAEGDARDIEIVSQIRRRGGDDLLIGVDANNGYDLAGAKRFMDAVGEVRIAFAEEMFPETVEDCLSFKAFFEQRGFDTLLADGETQGDLNVFKPFIEAQAIDVLQADMNRFGVEGILTEADWARPRGIRVAPHNWGSLIGYYLQVQVGRSVTNFYRAEHDPLSNDLIRADGYEIRDGAAAPPSAPGFGLTVNEDAFKSAKIHFDINT